MNYKTPVDEDAVCPICGHTIVKNTIVMIEEGEMFYSEKQQRHIFTPVGYTLEMFHLHCLQTAVESTHKKLEFDNNTHCCLCGDALDNEPSVFRITEGAVDEDEYVFVENYGPGEELQCVEVCAECVLMGIGDGDVDEGLDMLNLHQC